MPRKTAFTDQMHAALLQAFREKDRAFATIAKQVGLDVRTVKRAWDMGWPKTRMPPWDVPMRLVIEKEREETRARLASTPQPQQVVDKAKIDAAEQLAASVTLTRNCRKAASAYLGIIATMVPPTLELARKLADDAKSGAFKALQPEVVARLLHRATRCASAAVSMAETAQLMEHREAGKPTDILALASLGSDGPQLTLDEAERELKAAQNALTRARELGIEVLDGGQAAGAAGNGELKN